MAVQIIKPEIIKTDEELKTDFIYKLNNFQFDAKRLYDEHIKITKSFGIDPLKMGQQNLHVRSSAIDEGKSEKELFSDFSGSLAGAKNHIRDVKESEFDTIHPALEGTYTKEVIEEVMSFSFAKVGRVRWLTLSPKTCYSMHKDPDWYRLHIPLKTNEKSFFIVDEKYFTMPETGSLYVIHPQPLHLAANSSLHEERLHLVFDTAEEIDFY